MHTAHLAGWITDVRGRNRFVPLNSFVTSCTDPKVVVFNQQGYFFVPNLEAGKKYEFFVCNGDRRKRLVFTPKSGHNELALVLPTGPATKTKQPKAKKPLTSSHKKGA